MKFTKMQGCGNDYVYVNCFEEKINSPSELAVKISDRHFGIGADGLILILPPTNEDSDAFMQLYNADGSKASMCGNGVRCVAKYVYEHGLIANDRKDTFIDTPAGTKKISLNIHDNKVINASVDMGVATPTSEVPEKISIDGKNLCFIGVNVGNPHAVYFIEDNPEIKDICSWPDSVFAVEGVKFETHSRFPDRVNSEFIEIISRGEINMRVYERGSGETMACGTGATASAYAGVIAGKLNREVLVHLRGGDLKIKVDDDGRCIMTGAAVEVFSGEIVL
ncbi:MAG: diaminopimelate epimerase [Synergistaceae bacterium]|nr:diaminopimelate epimerase [Synergistaceae bacterium]